jgi:hypothetical protein
MLFVLLVCVAWLPVVCRAWLPVVCLVAWLPVLDCLLFVLLGVSQLTNSNERPNNIEQTNLMLLTLLNDDRDLPKFDEVPFPFLSMAKYEGNKGKRMGGEQHY